MVSAKPSVVHRRAGRSESFGRVVVERAGLAELRLLGLRFPRHRPRKSATRRPLHLKF